MQFIVKINPNTDIDRHALRVAVLLVNAANADEAAKKAKKFALSNYKISSYYSDYDPSKDVEYLVTQLVDAEIVELYRDFDE